MLHQAVQAFVNQDPELAKKTIETEDQVDVLRQAGVPAAMVNSSQTAADRAAVARPQRREEAEARHCQTGAERAHVDELAARDHECADDDERHRGDVRGSSDGGGEAVGDPPADHAPAPPEVEHRRQEQSQRDEPEPDQLRVLLVLRLPLAPLRADASRR